MKKKLLHILAKLALCLPVLLGFGCASFELTSEPVAEIYEDGRMIGETPLRFNMVSGGRSFTLKHKGYVEEDIFISSMDSRKQHYNLHWVGRTRIESKPRGARVLRSADGEELGITPCNLRLARAEKIKVTLEGFKPVEMDIAANGEYVIELEPIGGFETSFFKRIAYTAEQRYVDIYDRVAGKVIGTTPVELDLVAGAELEYRKEGYKTEVAIITRNAPYRVHINLEEIPHVTLLGPDGTVVYRPGSDLPIGKVPFRVKAEMDSIYELKSEGYYDSTVVVTPDSPAELTVSMEKIPMKTITTEPAGADIYRMGGVEKLGVSPYTTVVENERIFEIKMPGYESKMIGMGPSSPDTLAVPLNAKKGEDPDAAAIGTLDDAELRTF